MKIGNWLKFSKFIPESRIQWTDRSAK